VKVLVVGSTGFLGGAVADAARAAGHAVTVFTRGRTTRTPAPGVTVLTADRHGDLSELAGKHFDLVVDTCAFGPDAVARLLAVLGSMVGLYAFVSSASVYADFSMPSVDERSPTSRATPAQLDEQALCRPSCDRAPPHTVRPTVLSSANANSSPSTASATVPSSSAPVFSSGRATTRTG
jgi:NAD(P)-dependent dehydrogenase (short-subunit alcohol dehydrogenase family)